MDTDLLLPIEIEKTKKIDDLVIYNHFINWVSGEFDLYLQNETEKLQIYFPSGFFNIESFKDQNNHLSILIHIRGKSKIGCINIMKRLDKIYHHILLFNQNKEI